MAIKSTKLLFFIIMILLNTIMMSFYVESMHLIGPLKATVLNYAFNFIFTALFGYLLFNEPLSLIWWFGVSIILSGIILLTMNKYDKDEKNKKE